MRGLLRSGVIKIYPAIRNAQKNEQLAVVILFEQSKKLGCRVSQCRLMGIRPVAGRSSLASASRWAGIQNRSWPARRISQVSASVQICGLPVGPRTSRLIVVPKPPPCSQRMQPVALLCLPRRRFSATSRPDSEPPSVDDDKLRDLASNDLCTPGLTPQSAARSNEEQAKAKNLPPRTLLQSYLSLSKARLSAMVVTTAAAGFLAAPFEPSGTALIQLVLACGGTALASAGANTFNQVIETAHDSVMHRTKRRALPNGDVTPAHAMLFGTTVSAVGVGTLYFFCNPLAGILAGSTIALYAGVYTPIKRVSVLNTWIGSVVGAIPPLIGWAAATGGDLGAGALALGTVLFVWQLPHFLSLSWGIKEDYQRAGYQMLAAVAPEKVPRQTLLWSAAMLPLGGLCVISGISTPLFALDSAAFTGYLVWQARKFDQDHQSRSARKVFLSTLWWLPLFIVLMLLHKRRWAGHGGQESEDEAESSLSPPQ